MLLKKYQSVIQYRIMSCTTQAFLMIFFMWVLQGCQPVHYASRDVEHISSHSAMQYSAKVRYNRSLARLESYSVPVYSSLGKESLDIRISGKAHSLVHADYFSFTPRHISLTHNHCKIIRLMDTERQQAVPLQVCFVDNTLMIDPQPSDKEHPYVSSIFYPSPLWLIGAPLRGITTYGVARLKDATLSLRLIQDAQREAR